MVMVVGPAEGGACSPPPPAMGPALIPVPDAVAKDAILAWYRGEFAAANAIIDALCGHLTQLTGAADYSAVFAATHRRRMNWIPVLQMQKYHSIAEVMVELRNVGTATPENHSLILKNGDVFKAEDNCKSSSEEAKSCVEDEKVDDINIEVTGEDGSPESEITDSGRKKENIRSHRIQPSNSTQMPFLEN